MTDILLFGATGYTGRLTATALAERGARFCLAGRNHTALAQMAGATGAQEVRRADAADPNSLVRALRGMRVLVSCAGPFVDIGRAAADAALRVGTHYLDCSGEPVWVERLLRRDAEARAAGIAMAPAMGWDEAPGDVAASLAVPTTSVSATGPDPADLTLTYALPSQATTGTLRSAVRIAGAPGVWLSSGRPVPVRAGGGLRWAPMPPPLGVRPSLPWPLAEGHLAPLHLPLASLRTFVTAGTPARIGLRTLRPALPWLAGSRRADVIAAFLRRSVAQPSGPAGGRWTVLAEGASSQDRRNVVMSGLDPYGLTAAVLAAGACAMADPGYGVTGVVSPVQAMGLAPLRAELTRMGVQIRVLGPGGVHPKSSTGAEGRA